MNEAAPWSFTIGLSYDADGNLIDDGLNQYLYDAEGRLCAEQSHLTHAATGYLYDGMGHRIAKGTISSLSCDFTSNNFAQTNVYAPGPNGEQLEETDGSFNFMHANVFLDGKVLATYSGSGLAQTNWHYSLNDWLGTRRAQVNADGTPEGEFMSLPWGDGYTSTDNPPATENQFTGKERDTESGLDYFGARYYGSTMGRFMSPDPLGGHLEDPQTLNKYVYVRNNPLSLTDPTGLDFYLRCQTESSGCTSQTVGYDSKGNAQTALVQGVTDANGKFTATQIGNDANGNLVDKTTGTGAYTASVNGSGVQFSTDGGKTSSTGAFVNPDANPTSTQTSFQDAGWANGGNLSHFNFTFTNSKLEAGQTAAGTFDFSGDLDQARSAIQASGFRYWPVGVDFGSDEFRSPGDPGTGANSGHFIVNRGFLPPKSGVPQVDGNMHFGEHNPMYSPLVHFGEYGK